MTEAETWPCGCWVPKDVAFLAMWCHEHSAEISRRRGLEERRWLFEYEAGKVRKKIASERFPVGDPPQDWEKNT